MRTFTHNVSTIINIKHISSIDHIVLLWSVWWFGLAAFRTAVWYVLRRCGFSTKTLFHAVSRLIRLFVTSPTRITATEFLHRRHLNPGPLHVHRLRETTPSTIPAEPRCLCSFEVDENLVKYAALVERQFDSEDARTSRSPRSMNNFSQSSPELLN